MNTQNIFKSFGSLLDIKLDSSEYYDFDLAKTDNDYFLLPTDFTQPLTYNSLIIDESLENYDHNRTSIRLQEIDLSGVINNYIFSGLSLNVSYVSFTDQFDTSEYNYSDIILNNNIYIYTGIAGETHYFMITGYNQTPVIPVLVPFEPRFIECEGIITSGCCETPNKLNVKPWVYKINSGGGNDNCSYKIKRRTEQGWTLDFVFNRDNVAWSGGSTFYYFGVRSESDPYKYADNNLSFGFTDDGRIKWSSIHYSGYCLSDNSGYTESFYVTSGVTPQICVQNPNKDFNVTIVFKRYYKLEGCDLENEGGWNDLITGKTLLNDIQSILTGDTPLYEMKEVLNKNWFESREKRLGTLKIYINGIRIYKYENFEEIIPSDRGLQPFIQSWGGGTSLVGDLHRGVCRFNIKSIKYYEEPLDYLHIKYNFKNRINNYDFYICGESEICQDDITGENVGYLMTNDDYNISSQNNFSILYRS